MEPPYLSLFRGATGLGNGMVRAHTHVCAAAVVVALAAAALGFGASAQAGGDDRPVRGWLEHARLEPTGLKIDAKLDSGARTSSIHAQILRGPGSTADDDEEIVLDEEVEDTDAVVEVSAVRALADADEEIDEGDDDSNTIVFRITNEEGQSSTLQREIIRFVEIKGRDGANQRRPVVEMTVCLAGVWVTGEVNLTDREDFNYPFLVGRNMLEASGILVDAREIYTRRARCADPAP